MKTIIVYIFSALLMGVGSFSIVQAEDSLLLKTEEELHNGLRQLKSTMEKALNTGDIDTILANVDEHVVFTTMNGDIVRGKQAIKQYFTKMLTGPDRVVEQVTTKFEADDLSVLHGGDTAIAFGTTDDSYILADGSEFSIQARWSSTMVLRDNRWLVANFHYSTNMFDNPILKAQRMLLLEIAAVVTLIASIIFFLLGRRGSRNNTK